MRAISLLVVSTVAFAQGVAGQSADLQDAKPVVTVSDAYPSVSPDGKRIVFHSNRNGVEQVYVVNADGSGLAKLTDFPGGSLTPQWSPDGRRIVFTHGRDETSDIWLMDADGSHSHVLVATPGDDSHPQWSPDGSHVIFNTSRPVPGSKPEEQRTWEDIWIVSSDGSGMRRLTDCRATCTYPSPSPDGKRMAYRRVEQGGGLDWALQPSKGNSEVFVADIDGSHATNLSNNPAFDCWPAWSPDGRWIAFASNRAGPPRTGQIYLVHPDGTGMHALTHGPWSHVQPAWTRDGSAVYVQRLQENEGPEFGMLARVDVPR